MSRHEIALRRVLYEVPGMQAVPVRDAEFPGADGELLPMRIYGTLDRSRPAVVIVDGLPDARFEEHVGCRFMDMEWTISMAQLIAASGMTAITHSNRVPEPDARALIAHFETISSKFGIWATSSHAPIALLAAARARCAVLNNPVTRDFCPDTPLFVVRSGNDETPGLNVALDAFMARALADDRPLTLVNYPGARHSYELHLDTPETRRILQQGLEFLRAHLV